jgi:eukaryotic-like serine/threonine-protein kinase
MPLPESTTPATTREATHELSELNQLLLEFFELADEDQSRWLEALAIRLPEHHGRLLRMLNGAKTRDAQFLERSLDVEQVASKLSEASDDEEGDTIGSYRLIRKIGSGGMGTVWLAERSDGAINRRVALKLPSVGWSRALIERTRRSTMAG